MRRHAFFDHPGPIAMAHRGDHRKYTENTLESFQAALDLGYRFIETDIHASADGVAVLAHDPDLRRIAGLPLTISETSWSELAKVRLPCGSRLGRLDEALHAFPATRFNLDAKADTSVTAISAALGPHGERVCLGSFSHRRNLEIRGLLPHVAHSASPREVAALKFARGSFHADAAMIPVSAGPLKLASRKVLDRAHALGRFVHVWTVDQEREMSALLDLGVDGVMSDQPQLLKEVFMKRGIW